MTGVDRVLVVVNHRPARNSSQRSHGLLQTTEGFERQRAIARSSHRKASHPPAFDIQKHHHPRLLSSLVVDELLEGGGESFQYTEGAVLHQIGCSSGRRNQLPHRRWPGSRQGAL